jgi:hypothetical protein
MESFPPADQCKTERKTTSKNRRKKSQLLPGKNQEKHRKSGGTEVSIKTTTY